MKLLLLMTNTNNNLSQYQFNWYWDKHSNCPVINVSNSKMLIYDQCPKSFSLLHFWFWLYRQKINHYLTRTLLHLFFSIMSVTKRAKPPRITNTTSKISGLPIPNQSEEKNKATTRIASSTNITGPHSSTQPLPLSTNLWTQVQDTGV